MSLQDGVRAIDLFQHHHRANSWASVIFPRAELDPASRIASSLKPSAGPIANIIPTSTILMVPTQRLPVPPTRPVFPRVEQHEKWLRHTLSSHLSSAASLGNSCGSIGL